MGYTVFSRDSRYRNLKTTKVSDNRLWNIQSLIYRSRRLERFRHKTQKKVQMFHSTSLMKSEGRGGNTTAVQTGLKTGKDPNEMLGVLVWQTLICCGQDGTLVKNTNQHLAQISRVFSSLCVSVCALVGTVSSGERLTVVLHGILGSQNKRSETGKRFSQLQEGMLGKTKGLINVKRLHNTIFYMLNKNNLLSWVTCSSSLLPPLFSTSISRQRLRKSRKMGDSFSGLCSSGVPLVAIR